MTETWRARAQRLWRSVRKEALPSVTEPDAHDEAEVAAMLRELGIALLEVEQPSQLVAYRLLTIAPRYTSSAVRVVALPTMLVIQVGSVGYEVDTSTHATLQLDLAGRIDDIADLAAVGGITPADAIAAVSAARTMQPRFGVALTIGAYAVTTVGFGMTINPTWAALPGYLFLGLVVGAVVMLGRPFPALNPVLPTLCAMIATILATLFVADAANDGLVRVISPALVAILPGMALTIGAMELANSAIIAGASRLVYGVTQLGLLVFGVALGTHVAGQVAPQEPSPQMGSWSIYVAVVLVSIGLYVYLSAPRGSLIWLMAAIGVALVGQKVGGLFLSPSHSGAVGAFLVAPFAMVAAQIKSSPPAIVMMLASFWALVPGALSFVTLSQAATGGHADITTLGSTVSALFSIALGTLAGFSVFYAFRHPRARTAIR
jgi:uncharacterized membrane protein YjjP (DUF1212 family)